MWQTQQRSKRHSLVSTATLSCVNGWTDEKAKFIGTKGKIIELDSDKNITKLEFAGAKIFDFPDEAIQQGPLQIGCGADGIGSEEFDMDELNACV